MVSIFAGIILLIALVMIASILGVGTDLLKSAQKSLDDKIAEQTEQKDPQLSTVGYFANDNPGARVCNLKITFVGAVAGNLLDNDVRLSMGNYGTADGGLIGAPKPSDTSVIKYQWVCPHKGLAQASFLDMWGFNLANTLGNPIVSEGIASGTEQNLAKLEQNTKIRFYFYGESLDDGGKKMVGRIEEKGKFYTDFNKDQVIKAGTSLPAAFSVSAWLYDVTEGDYDIRYKSQEWEINDERVNHEFSYHLCKPGTKSC